MRFSIYLLLFAFSLVHCKNNVKALTESQGQEVIEIGAPIKELPPGLDEEPSAEFEEDDKTTSAPPTTKRETRKTTTLAPAPIAQKEASDLRSDSISQEDEEKRIEKEFSEIYKDTDYKAESSNSPSTSTSTTSSTSPTSTTVDMDTDPALRQRGRANFKFQPDVNDRADVERFRTSVDEISCEKRVTQRLQEMISIVALEPGIKSEEKQELRKTSASDRHLRSIIAMCLAFLSTLVCQ